MSDAMGDASGSRLVLLRFSGDISIKARATRKQFVARLLHNLRDAVASLGATPRVRLSHDRIFVELPAEVDVGALARVFGIQSISPVWRRCPAELDEIVRSGEVLFRESVRNRRFAVRTRRVGDRARIGLHSQDVERELGAALLPYAAGVDLGNPETTVHVEIEGSEAYLFGERVPAQGGLPLGVEGRAVALVSGGFDSAVAAWQLLRRGVALEYVFCNLGGATHQMGMLRVAKVLADDWSYGAQPQLHSIDFEPIVAELRARTTKRYWQILLKRLMLRAAARVAETCRAEAIVTGDAVGQVSSQTLRNLRAISGATDRMILRPLVGSNKQEIIEQARRIGSFDLSKVVREYCDLVPRRPATGASIRTIEAEEERLDLAILERAVAARTIFDLRSLDVEKLELPELQVESVPDDAIVIDLRSKDEYRSWHHPGALQLHFSQALAAHGSFERGKTYVLYCEFGLMSAHLAELMRRQGFDVWHFKGGTKALRRHSEAAAR
jgi:thiamine biosynthesis protein ThiI